MGVPLFSPGKVGIVRIRTQHFIIKQYENMSSAVRCQRQVSIAHEWILGLFNSARRGLEAIRITILRQTPILTKISTVCNVTI